MSPLVSVVGAIVILAMSTGGVLAQAPPCVTAPFGMVGWYPLNEQNGATAIADIHTSVSPPGPPHVGTPQPGPVGPIGPPGNGPAPVAPKVGAGALYFYGGRIVTVPPHPQLDFGTGDFSIDAWIRPVDVGQTVGGFIQPIVDKLDPIPPAGFALYLEGDTGGGPPHPSRLKLAMNGVVVASNGTIPFADPLANGGPWTHVAVTVRRSGPVQGALYINGVLDTTFTPPAGSVTNGLFLWIGETRIAGPRGEIAIDELELFGRELTPTEVFGLFGAGSAGKCANTISASIDLSRSVLAVGQALTGSLGVGNPGIPESADVYLGVLLQDGNTILFYTDASGTASAVGHLTDLASFRPIVAGVSLASQFSVVATDLLSYQRTASDPPGTNVLFFVALKAGALADGILGADEIIGLSIAPFVLP